MYINTVKFQKDQKNFYDFLGPFYLKKTLFLTKWAKMVKREQYIKMLYRIFFFDILGPFYLK